MREEGGDRINSASKNESSNLEWNMCLWGATDVCLHFYIDASLNKLKFIMQTWTFVQDALSNINYLNHDSEE